MQMVYFKPLLRGRSRPISTQQVKMLHRLGQISLQEIRKEVDRSSLNSKAEIKKSLQYKVGPSSITLYSDHPAFVFLEKGVTPHVMSYVRNKVVPIELSDLKGTPTRRDIKQGVAFRRLGVNPTSPGYPAQNFVKKGLKRARKKLMEEIVKGVLAGGR